MKQTRIEFPYMPNGRGFAYVEPNNAFMTAAQEFALSNSLDLAQPTGSVVVKNGVIVGYGANGSNYHRENQCQRVLLGIPTGQGYELCEGCHPKNHSEPNAINAAAEQEDTLKDSDLYLWGHWWCCQPCWEAIIAANIKTVYLQTGSEVDFNRSHPGNKLPTTSV